MSHAEIKNLIATIVLEKQGCKSVELFTELAIRLIRLNVEADDINLHSLVEECVEERTIIEIQFTLPNMPYRVKSFYLPEGSGIFEIIGIDV